MKGRLYENIRVKRGTKRSMKRRLDRKGKEKEEQRGRKY